MGVPQAPATPWGVGGDSQEAAAGGLRAGDSEDLEPGGGATKGGDKTIRRLLGWQVAGEARGKVFEQLLCHAPKNTNSSVTIILDLFNKAIPALWRRFKINC